MTSRLWAATWMLAVSSTVAAAPPPPVRAALPEIQPPASVTAPSPRLSQAERSASSSGSVPDEATSLLEAGYLDNAIQLLEADLGTNPYDAVALNNLAVTRARSAEVFSAFDLLDRAARLAPEHPVIAANRATLRDWIVRRIEVARPGGGWTSADVDRQLPEPPALWAAP